MNSQLIPAASVILARSRESHEMFAVRRADHLRFMGGFGAFPGGKKNAGDVDARTTAVRELFEETGVLLARQADGQFPTDIDALTQSRSELLDGSLDWNDFVERRQLRIDPADLVPVGSLVTPEFAPVRFNTAFFLAIVPPAQEPLVWPGELTEGEWASTEQLLDDWTRVGRLLSPPTVSLLEAARGSPILHLPERAGPLFELLATGVIPPIYFSPAVAMLPLRSVALPPSTHTNAYLVGTDLPYLVDPGAYQVEEQERLFEALDRLLAGRRLAGILLTHHHPDHVDAAGVCAARYSAPILAHATTASLLTGKVKIDRLLLPETPIDLGTAPNGSGSWSLEVVFTPGHASGHVCFHERRYGLLFVGDMVSTVSSVLIAPPDGNLAQYVASLRLLQRFPCRLLLPGHGSPSSRPGQLLADNLTHREERESQLVEALVPGPATVEELTREVYRGLPTHLMRFAEMQVRAGLVKLAAEQRASAASDGKWCAMR